MTAVSYEQEKLNVVMQTPGPDSVAEFRFQPQHDGLNSVEVIIVNTKPDDSEAVATATLTLSDENGQVLASRRLVTNATSHNSTVRLNFSPISDSSQKTLYLSMSGGVGNGLSLWGYSAAVWPGGQLINGGDAQALRMTTRYAFQWSTAFSEIGNMLGRFGGTIITLLLYLPLPGALMLSFAPVFKKWGPTVRLALGFALGASVWPLIWMWLTVLGFQFSAPILWGLLIVGWAAVIFQQVRQQVRTKSGLLASAELWLMMFFMLFIFLLRLLAVRDQAFLPWVDSSRHALITAIMRDSGQFLTTYEPYLPVNWSGYHYGFHTFSAGVAIMLGERVGLPDLLLATMQLLSTLVCLAVYAAGTLLTGRRAIGWIAAFMVGLPFLFPAYYSTWGRLTQISGMLVLPLLIGLLVHLSWGKPGRNMMIAVLAVLAAGLFLLHARLFFYFIPFGLVLVLFYGAGWLGKKKPSGWSWGYLYTGPMAHLFAIGLCAAVLVVPRLWRLVNETTYVGVGVVSANSGRPLLQFPIQYVNAGWEQWFWIAAGSALVLALIYYRLEAQGEQYLKITALMTLWLGLLYLMTAGPSLHPNWPILLPQASVNSAYIASFAAEAILIGIAVVLLFKTVDHFHRLAGFVTIAFMGAAFMGVGLFGIKNQVVVLNRVTILAKPAEIAAIEWIDENTPANAKIANNAWLWLNSTWAGTDASGWINPMTGRLTGTPPIDHIYNSRLFGITSGFNSAAKSISDWSQPESIELLRGNGFNYIYIGINDGGGGVDMDPAGLSRNSEVKPVYVEDGVYIFEILPAE